MQRDRRLGWGILGMVLRFLLIVLVTFGVHFLYMGFPIEGNDPLGPEALHQTLEREWENVGQLVQDDRTSALIQGSVEWTYRLLYKIPGIEALATIGTTPKDGSSDDYVRSAVPTFAPSPAAGSPDSFIIEPNW